MESMRVLVVEDEPYMAEAVRDGLRLEAIAADIAGDDADCWTRVPMIAAATTRPTAVGLSVLRDFGRAAV